MDFRTRRISRKESHFRPKAKISSLQNKLSPELKAHLITIGVGLGGILILLFLIFQVIRSLDFSSIVFSFGQKLQADDNGRTTILLAGIGGEGHDGGNLTDTTMVASVDYKNKMVPMVSIARDLYVKTEQTGKSRINEVFWLAKSKYGNEQGMYALQQTVSEILGVPVQYYVKVDFRGFEKIVDALGGIDVEVEKDIYDTQYPRGETIHYETFSLNKGPQHLDGATALKYARSRHGKGNERMDFDRTKRQQQLLYAIKDKALSIGVLTDPGKIQALYDSVSESIDTNLSLGEIIELAKLAKDIKKEDAVPVVLNDDPTECGGLIYAPAREYFDNAAVMLPAGNKYDYIHNFVNIFFNNTPLILKKEGIQVLNGTKVPGLAYEVMTILSQDCLNVVYYSNAEKRDLETTTIYYRPDAEGKMPATVELLEKMIPGQLTVTEGIPEAYLTTEKRQAAVVVIELGKDYMQNKLPNPFDTLKYLTAPAAATQQPGTGTQQ